MVQPDGLMDLWNEEIVSAKKLFKLDQDYFGASLELVSTFNSQYKRFKTKKAISMLVTDLGYELCW